MIETASPPSDQNPLRSPRRWFRFSLFRFSLRTLLIFVTVVALVLGLWIVPSERQRRFCKKLEESGGLGLLHVIETPQQRMNRFKIKLKWYDHYFHSLQEVMLETGSIAYLDELHQFGSLKRLTLFGQIQGAQIEELGRLSSLESLIISTGGHENERTLISISPLQNLYKLKTLGILGLRIRSAELEQVSRMKSLEAFYGEFEAETMQPNDLRYFGELPALETLRLWNVAIDEDRYEFIGLCKNLKDFELRNSSFGDRSVKFLANCKQLQSLQLSNVKITDQGLAEMPVLPEVEQVWLDKVSVTVQGLGHLKKFPKLKEVFLNNFSHELDDKEELQKLLPNVTIEY